MAPPVAVLIILGALAGCRPAGPPLAASGGRSFSLLVDQPSTHLLQNDPRWATETIGGSEEPVASAGCTLCSVAMALNRVGVAIDPMALNNALKAHGGYTEQGWLVWGAVIAASSTRARAEYHERFDHSTLDDALRRRCVPVVKFYLAAGISHWVVVVGKAGVDHIVRDPLDKTRKAVPLSRLTSQIRAFRCVKGLDQSAVGGP